MELDIDDSGYLNDNPNPKEKVDWKHSWKESKRMKGNMN